MSGFRILEGNASDEAQLKPTLDDHLRLFGGPDSWQRTAASIPKRTNG